MRIQLSDRFTYKKLLRFTLPSVAMMVVTSVYGVADGFFVSNFVRKTPFAAVNFIIPCLMILSTVELMFGAGGTAIVAKAFGEGDGERANRCFSLFTYVAFAPGAVLAVPGPAFIRPAAAFFGARGELLENSAVYARIILAALPFNVLQLLFRSFLVAAEKPQLGLVVTLSSGRYEYGFGRGFHHSAAAGIQACRRGRGDEPGGGRRPAVLLLPKQRQYPAARENAP